MAFSTISNMDAFTKITSSGGKRIVDSSRLPGVFMIFIVRTQKSIQRFVATFYVTPSAMLIEIVLKNGLEPSFVPSFPMLQPEKCPREQSERISA